MSVNPKADLYQGGLDIDPSAGGGLAAPIGTILFRVTTAQVWQKFGAGNTQWRRIELTDGDKGDITVSGSGATFTIDPGVVTNTKLADMTSARFKARISAGPGAPEDLTGTQATTLLDTFTSLLKGLVPASGGGTTNFLRADGAWAAPPGDVSGTAGWYGSGVDGAATIGAGTTTLTADKEYTTLVVQNTGILLTAGYTVRATGSITVDAGGNINNNGSASVGNGGGAGAAGASTSLLGGGGGGNGGTGNGNPGTGRTEQPKNLPTTGATSGVGGTGGTGSGSTGGSAGGYTQTTLNGSPWWMPYAIQGNFPYNTTTKIAGGTGGGGGGGSAGAGGASGGGGGGGIVTLASPTIANNGAIEAKGGGSAAATGANAGSGGGGGGGKVIIVCRTYTGTAPDVSGGTPGAKTGTGTQGATGSTGFVLTLSP